LKAEAARLMNVPCASKSSGANTGRAIGFRKLQAAARQAPPGSFFFFIFLKSSARQVCRLEKRSQNN